MVAFTLDSEAGLNAIKVAKKTLKKNDEPSMKLKSLAKIVATKLSLDVVSDKDVRKLLEKSDKFTIEGKLISLNKTKSVKDQDDKKASKKRKSTEDSSSSNKKKHSKKESLLNVETASAWRKEHKIVLKDTQEENGEVDGSSVSNRNRSLNQDPRLFPLCSFDSDECRASICPIFLKHCTDEKGFSKPSPIQAQCWPILSPGTDSSSDSSSSSSSRDIVGIAETGSGKTLAFALPALTSMHRDDQQPSQRSRSTTHSRRLPRLLVLAPTRELAMQSHEVIAEYGALVHLKSLVVYGGVPKHAQRDALSKRGGGVDCVAATPGRLKDLLQEGTCDLSNVQHLVLDEADRMLDMGFEVEVREIISRCPNPADNGRITYMFSATWPAEIRALAQTYMRPPQTLRVYVGFDTIVGQDGNDQVVDDSALSANRRVTQIVEVVEDRARDQRLRELLKKYHNKKKTSGLRDRILVFALYKKEAQRLENQLSREGWQCCSIHGDKNQADRSKALSEFKDGSNPLMVATDVAARGLDIPNVEYVINYTFPLTIEDYVHRIGRTGRAGKTGISHTFFQTGDKSHAGELQQVMKQAGQTVPSDLMKFGSTIKKKEHSLYGNFGPRGGTPMKKSTRITFD